MRHKKQGDNGCFALVPLLAMAGDGPSRSLLFSSDDREVVDVTRRRRGSSEGGGRERAEAPRRERAEPPSRQSDDQGQSAPIARPSRPSSSGGAPFGGISFGGRTSSGSKSSSAGCLTLPVLGLLLIVILCVGVIAVYFFFSSSPEEIATTVPTATLATARPSATAVLPTRAAASGATLTPAPSSPTRAPTAPLVAATTTSGKGNWLVLLYEDARDKVLDEDIFLDLNEAERVGSSDRVRIVAQLDRYRGQDGSGWRSVKRYLVTRDADLNTLRSQPISDLGQVNMSDSKTLVDFAVWAIKTYPADRVALILSDHGMGWPGGWVDPVNRSSSSRSLPIERAFGNMLYLHELDQALAAIRTQTNLSKFELVGLDACLMSQVEVMSALAPHARYAVASEETEPALGWAYTSFLSALTANPAMGGADLAKSIVKGYISEDQRIVDDQARAQLAGGGSVLDLFFGSSSRAPSAAEVTQEMEQDITLAAVDLQALPALMDSLNELANALQKAPPRAISQARGYAQSYTSIFGDSVPASYIDLGHFAKLLTRYVQDAAVTEASNRLAAALKNTVIAEKHGPDKSGSTGLAIYFPNSELYKSAVSGAPSYTAVANRFARESVWDDFLAYFFTGRGFTVKDNTVAVPAQGVAVRAPAAGGIQLSPLTLSAKTVSPGKSLTMSVDVTGVNVGYVKLFVGYYDRAANSINLTDSDYVQSSQTRELDGVYYPVWPESKYTIRFQWEPIVYAVNDGKQSVVALFQPETYGRSPEQAIYAVDGLYTSKAGDSRSARLYFRDGLLYQVIGFDLEDMTGAAREIPVQPGDTFTVLDKWLDLDQSGNVSQTVSVKGKTLTFGNQGFTWKELDAAEGDYVVGFIIEDLDGKQQTVFAQVTVN